MASTLCCLVLVLCLLVLGRAQVPYSYCMHFAKWFGARNVPLSRLGGSFVLQKGRLVCKSGCHGCPALHHRTGPLAPHDNHSLAEGHRFCPNLASNHLLCCWSAHKSLAPRTRTLLGVLGKQRSTLSPSRLCCSSFSVSVLHFAISPNSGVKFFWGFSEVGKIDFALYFLWLCVFFLVFHFLLLRSRDCPDPGLAWGSATTTRGISRCMPSMQPP